MASRGEFSSKLGFIMAAAGSAVGLGNIWGFPTQVASNGGGAFVLVYIALTFLLAYPVLMAELLIGRYAKANMVSAAEQISSGRKSLILGRAVGYWGLLVASLIISFYAIIAGWMIAFGLEPFSDLLGFNEFSDWLTDFGTSRNIVFCALFYALTIAIVCRSVSQGIERWSRRLMPLLLFIIVCLIGYVASLEGAMAGWKVYLVPDFSRVLNPDLVLNAMGQAFFSMSLGVGTMLVYGSYISRRENLPSLGTSVTLVDIGVAVLAGLMIIPAMYVAQHNGVTIYSETGTLIGGDTLIFTVLPALFNTMGMAGNFVAIVFFLLMTIAALTSSISMLEVPVAYTSELFSLSRTKTASMIGGSLFLVSVLIILNFEQLFGLVIAFTTQYSQPMLGLFLCIFAGWIWRRNQILAELKQGYPDAEQGLFWKIWPFYVRFACPLMIILMFYRSFFSE